MTGGKRLRIAALFVIVLVFAFIMDMSSNAITDNTLIRNDTGDGDAVYDLVLNADGLDEDYSYQLKVREEQPSEKQANELFTQAKKEIDDSFCEENQSVEQVRGHVIMKDAYASGAVEAEWTLRAQSGSLLGWFSLENLLFAKDFGLFCFVFAMTGVESRPTKDASTTPSSYNFHTRLAMIDFNAPLFNCRRQRSYVQ